MKMMATIDDFFSIKKEDGELTFTFQGTEQNPLYLVDSDGTTLRHNQSDAVRLMRFLSSGEGFYKHTASRVNEPTQIHNTGFEEHRYNHSGSIGDAVISMDVRVGINIELEHQDQGYAPHVLAYGPLSIVVTYSEEVGGLKEQITEGIIKQLNRYHFSATRPGYEESKPPVQRVTSC